MQHLASKRIIQLKNNLRRDIWALFGFTGPSFLLLYLNQANGRLKLYGLYLSAKDSTCAEGDIPVVRAVSGSIGIVRA